MLQAPQFKLIKRIADQKGAQVKRYQSKLKELGWAGEEDGQNDAD